MLLSLYLAAATIFCSILIFNDSLWDFLASDSILIQRHLDESRNDITFYAERYARTIHVLDTWRSFAP